jgi:hypothetical protein
MPHEQAEGCPGSLVRSDLVKNHLRARNLEIGGLPSSTKADHLKMLSRFQIDDRRKELQISHQAVCFAAMSTRIKAYISCSLYNGIKEKRYS